MPAHAPVRVHLGNVQVRNVKEPERKESVEGGWEKKKKETRMKRDGFEKRKRKRERRGEAGRGEAVPKKLIIDGRQA